MNPHNAASPRPLVGLPCDRKMLGDLPFSAAGEKYVTALMDAAEVDPVLLPAPEDRLWTDTALDRLLDRLDGLLIPGSHSNVDPKHYDGGPSQRPDLLDPARDALTLPLIRRAIARTVPVFAICRGFQELNVVLGGTLHEAVQEQPSLTGHAVRMDHREIPNLTVTERYGPQHEIALAQDGLMVRLAGPGPHKVNSLHGQGIDRLAAGLHIEAKAPDGLIEAVSMPDVPGFVLGVQWHPEWRPAETPHYQALFQAFGAACRSYAQTRGA